MTSTLTPMQACRSPLRPLVIRTATVNDARITLRLFRDGIHIAAADHFSAESLAEWAALRSEDGHRQLISTKVVLVASLKQEPAGFVALDVEAGGVAVLVADLESGGYGVAGCLLAAVDAVAAEAGLTHVTARTTRRAFEVFGRCGYAVAEPLLVAGEGRGPEIYVVGKHLPPPRPLVHATGGPSHGSRPSGPRTAYAATTLQRPESTLSPCPSLT